MGLGNPPKPATREIKVWVIEVHLVKDVEHLGAELHVDSLSDLSVFEESHEFAARCRSLATPGG